MESEKVKEIKKALEDNANYKHHNRLGYIDGYKCKTVTYANILTLINELESENEKLNKALVANLDAYRDGFTDGANLNNKVENKWKEENQQLKDKVTELESENERLKIVVDIAKYRQRRL